MSTSTFRSSARSIDTESSTATLLDETAHRIGADNYQTVDDTFGGINQERWFKVRERLGIPADQELHSLGVGGFGAAYDIGNNKVLKLTRDKVEAYAAEKLRKHPIPEAYHVFDVFKIDKSGPLDTFGIVMEKLEQLPYYDEWREAIGVLKTMTNSLLTVEAVRGYFDELQSAFYEGHQPPDGFIEWAFSAAQHFAELGIVPRDFHGKNLMKRPGTNEHVIIDIGAASRAPRQNLPQASAR